MDALRKILAWFKKIGNQKIETHWIMKSKFWVIVFVLCGIFFGIEYFWLSKIATKVFGAELNYGWAVFFGHLFYLIISLKQVGPAEIGAILLFGDPIREVGSGLAFVPKGICTLVKESAAVEQEQYPADPEKVWKGDSDKMPLDGKFVPPIRITHKPGTVEEVNADPLHKRMTTEVSIIVRFRIKKGYFITFLRTIVSIKEAKRQIRDTIIATTRKDFAKMTPAETLQKWEVVDKKLKGEVKILVKSWGVKVEDVRMEDLDLGRNVNTALRDVPKAALTKEKTIIDADGEKYKRTHEGMGTAEARRIFLEAEAVGYKKIAKELGITEGAFILAMESARTAMEKSQYSIVSGSGGMKDIFSIASAIQSILPKIKEKVDESAKKKGGVE